MCYNYCITLNFAFTLISVDNPWPFTFIETQVYLAFMLTCICSQYELHDIPSFVLVFSNFYLLLYYTLSAPSLLLYFSGC